jgi:hypothetical protein
MPSLVFNANDIKPNCHITPHLFELFIEDCVDPLDNDLDDNPLHTAFNILWTDADQGAGWPTVTSYMRENIDSYSCYSLPCQLTAAVAERWERLISLFV